ncbi:galactosidase [Vibrio cincinnatiensis]|uniref:glycoside hydrolase family 53 protein n=1 Tax=Vibrio cincinnatiensis TaxID=675 RepID=UPI001EE0DBD4|nr:glycosyl hydrolase 53 family protein [Vibrio cincinnatiensis]MCG3765825.1 galactosidase [Vibrio cincinnatiensis]
MNVTYKKTLAAVLSSALLLAGCKSGEMFSDSNSTQSVIIPAQVSEYFIKGMDVSMIPEVEALGGKYYQDNQQKDPIAIMQAHGINYLRMRIWVDPQSASGVEYGGGNSTLERAIAMGKRAHEHGMKYLLDIHYSDFWTDPGKQVKPKGWETLSFEELVAQVGHYTEEVMQAHRDAGVMPEMVQVGNELNSGMLWPDGKSWGGDGHEFDRLAELLNAGIQAVKAAYQENENVEIMLHLAKAGDNGAFRWWFDEITKRNVEFDIIGMSYYPFWHGPMDKVEENIADVISRYGKPVVIAETSYAYTTANGDSLENAYTGAEPAEGYPVSVAGQALFLKEMMELVNAAPEGKGLGIFYWEPAWLPVDNATWATQAGMKYTNDLWQEGNSWDNQALFDFEGNVLPSMNVFKNE